MKKGKKLEIILSGQHDNNIKFTDVLIVLKTLEFKERVKGDHHIFTKNGIEEIINIQPRNDGKAKAYQIKQIRNIFIKYKIQ